MMYGKFKGIIGGKSLRPTKTVDMKRRGDSGAMKPVPFMRFTMFCEDMTKKPEPDKNTGRMQRPRKQVQIILPENQRGEKLFEHLSPGRQIQVEGRTTNDPKMKNDTLYPNDKCYMDDLTFLDSPRDKQITRALDDMVSAGLITAEMATRHNSKMQDYYRSRATGDNAPRIYIDNTSTQESCYVPNNPDNMPL